MHLLLVFLVKPRWLIIRLSAKLWPICWVPRVCEPAARERSLFLFEMKAKLFFGLIVDAATPSGPNLSCISSLNFAVDYTNAAAAVRARQIWALLYNSDNRSSHMRRRTTPPICRQDETTEIWMQTRAGSKQSPPTRWIPTSTTFRPTVLFYSSAFHLSYL